MGKAKKEEKEVSVLRRLWLALKHRGSKLDIYNKAGFNSNKPVPWNIYGAKTLGEGLSRFKIIHMTFKYKFFVPFLWIVRRILRKHWDDEVPKEEYNKNLIIFRNAFDTTINQFLQVYLTDTDMPEDKKKAHYEKMMKCDSVKLLETLKRMVLLMAVNDTAYREFLNMLMHSIAQLMIREYKGKRVNHLLYSSDSVYDVNYVLMMRKLQEPIPPLEVKNDNTTRTENTKQTKESKKKSRKSNKGKDRRS